MSNQVRDEKRVEFIGSPGAGKSTTFAWALDGDLGIDRTNVIRDRLRTGASDRLVRAISRVMPSTIAARQSYALFHRSRDFPRMYFKFAAEHPALVGLVSSFATDEIHPSVRPWRLLQKHAEMQSVHQLCWGPEAPKRNGSRAILLDEEFSQLLLLTLAASDRADRVDTARRYLDLVPLPAAVVAVHTPPEQCVERLQERNHGWPFLVRSKRGAEFLHRLADAFETTITLLRERDVSLVEVDGNQSEVDQRALLDHLRAGLASPDR